MLISPVSKTTRMNYVFEIGNCLRTGDLAGAIEAADRHSNMTHSLLTRPLRKLHCDLVALSREGAGTEADKARRFYTEEFYERACGVLDWDLVRACGEKEAGYD